MKRRHIVSIIIILMALARAAYGQPAPPDAADSSSGGIPVLLVRLNDTAGDAHYSLFARLSLHPLDSVRLGPLRIFALLPDAAGAGRAEEHLRASGLFAYVERNRPLADISKPDIRLEPVAPPIAYPQQQGTFPPNDPLFDQQHALRNRGNAPGMVSGADIGIEEAWSITEGDSTVVIAIGEEGFQASHPDLLGQFVADSAQLALMDNNNPHGTLVAGVVAARKGNGEGIAGVAPGCRLLVAHSEYGTSTLGVLKALEKVLQWNAVVFSSSWGFFQTHLQPLQEAYDIVARTGRGGKGTLMIFAAGNEGRPWVHYPAWHSRFMTVGATTPAGGRWLPGNYGLELDVSAPGADIITTSAGSGYMAASGTSLAAPIVAGIAGLICSADTSLTAERIRAIIEQTCDKVGGYRYDRKREHGTWSPYTGYGGVNAGRALRMARGIPDERPRILWPRGGELLYTGADHTIRWKAGPGARIGIRESDGSLTWLTTPAGADSMLWIRTRPGTLRLLLADAGGLLLDSLPQPLLVRDSAYTVNVDTLAAFISIAEMGKDGEPLFRSTAHPKIALPFDMMIGKDTVWGWSRSPWGLTGIPLNGASLGPSFDPHAERPAALADFLCNDLLGVDSVRFAILGAAPRRQAIVEYIGGRLDSLLYTKEERDGARKLRRQIRLHEADGSISFHYNMAFAVRGDSPEAQGGGIVVALKIGGETIHPLGSEYLRRIPAGCITFRPVKYAPPLTPPRMAVIATDRERSYGYDIYRATVLTNSTGPVPFRASTDEGLTWQGAGTIAPGEQIARLMVPPAHAGTLLVALSGEYDQGWRDTIAVTDHGYTIERIEQEGTGPIARNPAAERIMTAGSGSSVELTLPFGLPYFGETFSRFRIHRAGWVEPLGSNQSYMMMKPFPRFSQDDPDSLAPVHMLIATENGRRVAIVEWDSLARYEWWGSGPEGAPYNHGGVAQIRLYEDGVIEMHLFATEPGRAPYHAIPSIAMGGYFLASPDFTMRGDPLAHLPMPLPSYRFIPRAPVSGIAEDAIGTPRNKTVREPKAHPNPATGIVTVAAPEGNEWRSIIVMNTYGETITRLQGKGDLHWNSAGMPAGLYLLRDEHGGAAARVVILR